MELYTKDLTGLDWEAALPLLPPGRAARALRYANPADRRRSVGAALLLAERFGRDVALSYNQYGKPFLLGENVPCISLSHAGELCALAVSERPIGVDVERLRCSLPVAERFFTPPEVHALRALSGEAQARLFTRLWTAREAWLKMRGVGLMWLSETPILFGEDGGIRFFGAEFYEEARGDYHLSVVTELK
ncbi:MAG: 4'-phosphopantetheinyl transferase family protein [bacterium]